MKITRPTWSPLMKLSAIILLFSLAVYFLYKFRGGIEPVILACILAYVMSPLVNWFHRRLRMKRSVAILMAYLILLLIIGMILFLVFPMLFRQVRRLNLNVQELYLNILQIIGRNWVVFGVVIDGQRVLGSISGSLQDMISPLFGQSLGVLGRLLTSLAWIGFIIVASIYLVKDSEALGNWLLRLPPPDYRDDFVRIGYEIRTIWSSFFRGQLLLSVIVMGILTAIGLLIGLPYALLMGLVGGLLEFLPSLGHGTWLVLAIILALVRGSDLIPIPHWMFAVIVLIATTAFDQFDANYLIPRIIGRSVRLPALVVILGIVIGASVAGLLGVALAAPTVASMRIIGRYIYARLFDLEPFPVEEESFTPLPAPDIRWWIKRPAPKKDQAPQQSPTNE